MSDSPRRALITGGAGFIGSTLADRLLADGWAVTSVDSFEGFYDRTVKERNVKAARANPRYELVEVDTRHAAALEAAVARSRPEVIIDLAARAGVRPSLADPGLYIDINVRGLQNTLAAAGKVGARLVFASSSSVYGDDDRRPFREDQMRGRPASPYGATKIAGEALVHAHHVATNLPVAIARLFTVYGPRQRPDLAIHAFARRILNGDEITLFDDGKGVRDYTYVDDVVGAFVAMMNTRRETLTANVGSHAPVTTAEMVTALERHLGKTARRRLLPAQLGDVPATYADISVATAALGWKPAWTFDEGVARFCRWLRSEEAG
jgi:UDP-glucuronate 4-epimerase